MPGEIGRMAGRYRYTAIGITAEREQIVEIGEKFDTRPLHKCDRLGASAQASFRAGRYRDEAQGTTMDRSLYGSKGEGGAVCDTLRPCRSRPYERTSTFGVSFETAE
jgi:hypothetical protein